MNVGQAIVDALAAKKVEHLARENDALRRENAELREQLTSLALVLACERATKTITPGKQT